MVTTGVTVAEKVMVQEGHEKSREKPINRRERSRRQRAAEVCTPPLWADSWVAALSRACDPWPVGRSLERAPGE
jgi:hypothetical protein